MAIFRGTGGSGDSTTDSTVSAVTQKAVEADASATAAASSATLAANSASSASTSATNAATSETNAATSASNASTSETNAANSAYNASVYRDETQTLKTQTDSLKNTTILAATAASGHADDAETAQIAAETARTAAETAQGLAESALTAAEIAQTAAETAETNAETAQTAAETAQASAETAYDNFDDRYLGSKTSDPTVDNDGDALLTGALYWNSTTNKFMVYSGSAWEVGSPKTNAEVKTAYESNANTNAFTDAEQTKLSGIETGATADQTASEIKTAYESNANTNAFTDNEKTKLSNIEANADVTDTANVASAGALMKSGGTMTGALTLSGAPTSDNHAATKVYVDDLIAAGIHYHDPVRVESPDSAGNLTATYDNGTNGVGATLTNSGTQEALVIDGVTLSTSDRVLIYNQTNAFENGIYTVTNVGSASTNWVLTRATDADSYGLGNTELSEGTSVFVTEGNDGSGEVYTCTTTDTITFGTTAINFSQIGKSAVLTGGTAITVSGNTINVTDNSIGATQLNVSGNGTSGQVLKSDGDGTFSWANDNDTTYSNATTSAAGLMSSGDKTKLDGIDTGAEVNQNAFSNIAVSGQTTVAADGKTDTLTFVAGSNVTITTDATGDSVTISSTDTNTDTTYTAGTGLTLDGTEFDVNVNATTQTTAPNTVSSTASRTYAVQVDGSDNLVVNVPWSDTDTTYSNATTSVSGLMSASDKTKLESIEANADVTDATNVEAAGALMDSEVTNLAQVKAFNSSDYATAAQGTKADNALPKAGGTVTGEVIFADDIEATFGNNDDLSIFRNSLATTSIIGNRTGDLLISNTADDKDVIISTDNGDGTGASNYFRADGSTGDAILYHYGSEKIKTQSGGVDVTGNITVSGTVDGRDIASDGTKLDGIATSATANPNAIDSLVEDTTPQLGGDLDTNGNNIYLDQQRFLKFDGDTLNFWMGYQTYENAITSNNRDFVINMGNTGGNRKFSIANGGYTSGHKYAALFDPRGKQTLYYDNVQKFETTSTGVDVTGEVQCDSLDVDGAIDLDTTAFGVAINVETSNASTSTGGPDIYLYNNNSAYATYPNTPSGGIWFGSRHQYAGFTHSEIRAVKVSGNVPGYEGYLSFRNAGATSTTQIERMKMSKNGIIINDSGDVGTDFRVESDLNQHMLFVDASADAIGINNSSPSCELDVTGTIKENGVTIAGRSLVMALALG